MPTRTGGDGDVHHADYFADISDQGNNSKTQVSRSRRRTDSDTAVYVNAPTRSMVTGKRWSRARQGRCR